MIRSAAPTGKLLVSTTLALALFTVGARPVHAAADDAAADPAAPGARAGAVARLSDEGFAFYKTRDYRHAAEKFLQAYALDQDPNLLFNIARCYEAMGDRDSAIEKYEAFLAKPDADAQGKRRANEAIRALHQQKSAVAEAAIPPSMAPPVRSPAAVDARPQPRSSDGGGNAAGDEKSSFLGAPVVTLAAGVLVAAAGAISYSMGASDHSKVTGSANYGKAGQVDPLTEAEAQRLIDSGNTKKLIGGIALGVGGALLATSAVLFAVGHRAEGKAPGAVAFGAVPFTGGGELLLQGRF